MHTIHILHILTNYTYSRVYIYEINTYVCMYSHPCVRICMHMYVYTYIYIYIHIFTYIYAYAYMYI